MHSTAEFRGTMTLHERGKLSGGDRILGSVIIEGYAAKRLRLRIRELEDQQSRVSIESSTSSPLATASSSIETTSSKLGGVFHVQCENPIGNGGPIVARSMMHKTRMFGQSHWCVTGVLLIRDIFETIDAQLQERGAEAWAGITRCKGLARFIKARRSPPWPPTKLSPLPEKPLADRLVENYLQNTESLYRVLHIPTFREQYDALWVAGSAPDTAFLVQTVQTNILLLFAQERLGIIADSMSISMGWLIRRAMYMGLHRDPARLPERTVLTCEMHRRLWNTIAESNLQSSLGSRGSVFLSMSDFDTKTPGNFDNEQLLELDPVARPAHECTQMTMALALRETFAQRLDALRFLNDVSSGGSYDETLRQGAKQALTSTELRVLDIIMYRYLTALHVPYFVAAMQDAKYAYSRVVVVDCVLKIWTSLAGRTWMHASCAQSPIGAADNLRRQVTRGMSFFMIAAMHSALLIVMELRAQLKESDGLGGGGNEPVFQS
ncbi:C6 transcription factor, putative [Beauveria bassiana ARSEF 2860]|uniref:C6 transcription factor, putative n=1 Tax=Beauveria bassiana (strain ARSEF 2860) TaxID=655819 RepID=J4UIE4_BEAB2|nr:C6 transcription factor, putative [Beauveria bassiana ARSEF 2860]EJP63252.1 C6 transcription factor, putative [Beauveria bassiana ARSEF 2860]